MVQYCLYFSLIFANKSLGSLMIHLKTNTWHKHLIASRAWIKMQKIFLWIFVNKTTNKNLYFFGTIT